MSDPSRRSFLKNLSIGSAAFSISPESASPQADQMPGRPPASGSSSQSASPSAIMAVAAHPGDAFFAMGATVALQVHLGARGVFLSLSLGERGSREIPPPQYGNEQRQASEQAAQMLGASAIFLSYPDGEIPVSDESKLAVCDLIREHRPDVIVTHWRGSWHKDHVACYEIVHDAVFYAGLPALSRLKPAHAVKGLYFADNWEDADGFQPDTYLDVTAVFEHWLAACDAFPMWRGETGFRYHDYYRSRAIERGCLASFKAAVALMSSPEQHTRHIQVL